MYNFKKTNIMRTKLTSALIALLSVFVLSAPASADKDTPINLNQLPAAAQQVIKTHFAGKKVALAKYDKDITDKSYDVIFTDGSKLEFDRNGKWTEIFCPTGSVPTALVPAAITQYVNTHYAPAKIIKIERDKRETEIKLSDGMEITFNTKYQVTDIDR